MPESNFKEKSGFIVALFAAFIALNFYSCFFENIKLFFGPYEYPLIAVFNGMLCLLFVCVYFYALDYTRIPSPNEWIILRFFKEVGNFFYALALIMLPLAIIAHSLSFGINQLRELSTTYAPLISAIFSILSGLVGALTAWRLSRSITKRQKSDAVKEIQSNEEIAIKQAEELYKQGFYSSALVEMGKLIEISLQKSLFQKKNLEVQRVGLHQLLDVAIKNKIINQEIASSIKEIIAMRNSAAHLQIKFKKKDAEWALKETNKILNSLDPKNKWD